MNIWNLLKEKFHVSQIHWRVGATTRDKTKGMVLAYIDARDVMERLDSVVGPQNWSDKYFETAQGRVICELSININGNWVTKSDGAGDTGTEGEKGAISDAFKRAAVKFGIGRHLYSIGNVWVELDQYKGIKNPDGIPAHAAVKEHFSQKRIDKELSQRVLSAVVCAIEQQDPSSMREVWEELKEHEQSYVWRLFSHNQQTQIRELLKDPSQQYSDSTHGV